MQYFGGKAKTAKYIVSILNEYRKPNQLFIEPFCGGLNITCLMGDNVIANDKNFELIELYKAVQNGWTPPENVSEDDYINVKNSEDFKLKAFIGIGCSYSGKWFGGYARNNKGRNYAKNAKNSIEKKFNSIGQNVEFISKSYDELLFENALVYCDPPYNETTNYKFGKFDSEKFWDWCRNTSKKGNTVIISEYNAPNDFKCIWSMETKTDIRTKINGRETRIEKLFIAP